MTTLPTPLRNQLEKAVVAARDTAEEGARAALQALAVHHHEPFGHMPPEDRQLRNRLRAHARQLGDRLDPRTGLQSIDRLAAECAYAHWHRMLFARFLAENHLLIEPELGVAISLEECEELSREEGTDRWTLASRYAQQMLPRIFRPDDPLLQVTLAMEHRLKLEEVLDGLEPAVFTASDSLGWVYQFWQSKKKEEVNRSEKKIGADELPAVTQLFTEPYMVQFLIHNTLGAWHAGKVLAVQPDLGQNAGGEGELRLAVALPGVSWDYLRFVRENEGQGPWRPAAGTFDAWPGSAAELKVLDPCCGSGHFLVALLHHLVPLRMSEEGLSAGEACDAVLRDNLFGLEIDERCTQIAAFALALAAWQYPDAGGYRVLPDLHIACSGLPVSVAKEEWKRLALDKMSLTNFPSPPSSSIPSSSSPPPTLSFRAKARNLDGPLGTLRSLPSVEMTEGPDGSGSYPEKQHNLRIALDWMYDVFRDAPVLGSLINPARSAAAKIVSWDELSGMLQQALSQEHTDAECEMGVVAQGLAKAAQLLAGQYHWVITNVPYRKRGDHCNILRGFCEQYSPDGKSDIATVFLERCLDYCEARGSTSIVLPQNWLFLPTHKRFRKKLLDRCAWHFIAQLGPGAFETITGEVVQAILLIISPQTRRSTAPFRHDNDERTYSISGLDVSVMRTPADKAVGLIVIEIRQIEQSKQVDNPDCRISFIKPNELPLLKDFASFHNGIQTGDYLRYVRQSWELPRLTDGWTLYQSTVSRTILYGGRHRIIWWEEGKGTLATSPGSVIRGTEAWGKCGVSISATGELFGSIYSGNLYDENTVAIIPKNGANWRSIWKFCSDPSYNSEVRKINQTLKVRADLIKIPFDLDHWQDVATEKYPHGLPKPYSDDPTQWIFHGHPVPSEHPLQVAVARLLAYRWPAELDPEMELSDEARAWVRKCEDLLDLADEDGILCIPSVRGEEAAADRLEQLLAKAYGPEWSTARLKQLLDATGANAANLEDWLRNHFFEQHCKLFHQRPFIWHIWDGRKRDGFHALVNYHKLAEGDGKGRKLLETLTYSYLGDWITHQKDGVSRGVGGAEDRLVAALELEKRLKAILEGEPPFDLFIRWKSIQKQPIGWEPDINDGVRLNIRPFMAPDLPTGEKGADIPGGKKGAGVLRWKPNIHWEKDRGKDVASSPWYHLFKGDRINNHHLTNAEKRAARGLR